MTRVARTTRWDRRLALLVVVVIAADWLTKFIVLNRVALNHRVTLIGSWLSVVHVNNEGIAFSLLSDSSAAWRSPLLITAIAASIAVLIRVSGSMPDRLSRISLALIVAGAVGNLGDRLLDGTVTDFLAIRYFPYIFNVADVAVVTGGALLAIAFFTRHASPTTSPPAPRSG